MYFSDIIVNNEFNGLNPIQFGYQDCRPSHSFGPAIRDYWLIHYVVSGFGIFRRDGTEHKVSPGQMFVIPPYLETYYEADSEKPWSYIWIGFTCDSKLPTELNAVVTSPESGKCFELMKQCKDYEQGKSAYLCGLLWQVFGNILEQSRVNEDYIEKAKSYIEAEYINAVTVKEIADKLNLDRCYFSSLFKSRLGISPQQYLINKRMEKAATLMLKHGEKPSVAAASVGYSDIFVFSKVFKKHFGVSPRKYADLNNNSDV